MKCEEVDELAGAYALQALTPEETTAVEQHLAGCQKHASLRGLLAVAGVLTAAAPEMEPPARLKARLMAAVRAEAAAREALPGRPRAPGPLQRLFGGLRAMPALTAALALVVVALAGWNLYLQAEDRGASSTTAAVRDLTGGEVQGTVVYLRDEGVTVLRVTGLPALPEDKIYQVWAIRAGAPSGIGLFRAPATGEALATMTADLSAADAVAVTVEPAGGSPQPTTAPVLQANL